MTIDCGHRGSGYPNFDRYPLPLPRSCPPSPSFGTRDRSQKTAGPFAKRSPSCACALSTQKMPAPGRKDSEDTAGPRNR
ncbi:unnamed protein product [Staurois parvus]|uniref:Uncharacterized protein n=1 Tax=Staurois parvus TaxID=386267 RepID=A0ABN9FRD0_9NEOB|nr:unnamed protein product [Staurois parvus]